MDDLQRYIVVFYLIFSFVGFIKGFIESKQRKNTLGKTGVYNLNGAFVWADEVVFGIFWTLISLLTLFLNNWILFLLFQSIFWLVRSAGETIYWFLQQFSKINRNPAERFWIKNIFHDEYTVWFVFQIGWQCVTVITAITTIYLVRLIG